MNRSWRRNDVSFSLSLSDGGRHPPEGGAGGGGEEPPWKSEAVVHSGQTSPR
ncbi:hypothetical protein EYF80_066086 [Liparis tanakae]|uniref:Uncharacterized protein n=1 Tax=Liparis tanakae TaxID=230148 RepID=A0A4Z2E620_9TELE|nr:hypothetical protein EYF80_066086 [Liparis tanakae]